MKDIDANPGASEPGMGLPRQFGAYELIEEIGRGGAGIVFKARQPVLNRMCAVKMLLTGRTLGGETEAVLHTEATAAASLDHPNIVGVYEAGFVDGRRFFSMEFVEGRTLDHLVRERMLTAQEVARYVQTIARAIHYAHGRGVLHRDLKPRNIIIDPHDQPQITDFGLTKGIHEPDRPGVGAGSPNFMAPEQASNRFGDTGIHTDVFGIGALLYFLLTDRPPFRGETIEDTLNAVVRTEPVRPRQFRTGVPVDLETICLKCLEKNPAHRYRNALEVAEELQRFLADEPIHARPVGRMERCVRWCRRHPALAGFASATGLLLLLLAIGGPLMAYRIRSQRDFTRHNLYAADMALAFQALQSGADRQVREILAQYTPDKTDGSDLRGWEWHHLAERSRDQSLSILGSYSNTPSIVRLLDQGRRCIVSDFGGGLAVWNIPERRLEWRRIVRTNGNSLFAISPDGTTAVVFDREAGRTDTVLQFVATVDGRPLRSLTIPDVAHPFAMDSTGAVWVVVRNEARHIDGIRGQVLKTVQFPTNAIETAISASPDGRWLAAGLIDNTVYLAPMAEPQRARLLRGVQSLTNYLGASIIALEFSPDSTRFATCGRDGAVGVWSAQEGRLLTRIRAHPDLVVSACFSADNQLLATVGRDPRVCVWKLPGGELFSEHRGVHTLARSVQFLPGNGEFLTSADDLTLRLWKTQLQPQQQKFTNLPPEVQSITTLPNGEYVGWTRHDGSSAFHHLPTGREVAAWSDAATVVGFAATSSFDGRAAAVRMTSKGVIQVQDLGTGRRHEWAITNWVEAGLASGVTLEITRDLQRLATADSVNGISIWALDTGELQTHFAMPGFNALAFAPTQPWLAYTGRTSPPRIRDYASGRDWPMEFPVGLCQATLFTLDNRYFAAAGLDGVVHVFETQSGRRVQRLTSRTTGLIAIAAAPDSSRFFAASVDGFVTVWDPLTGRELALFQAHSKPISGLEYLPDGRLMTGAADGILFWPGPPRSVAGR